MLIALYYLTYHIYTGILNPIPALGDSWDFHIPISKTILDGRFLHPSNFKIPPWYYPGSSEAINSVFIVFNIPLTLSNVLATLVLFFCCWKLALRFRLQNYYALIFALTFSTLNVVIRWLNAINIDIWVGVFFALGIILLENPKRSLIYSVKIGFVLGMLIGSKYSGLLFFFTLIVFYLRNLLPVLNFLRVFIFSIPFAIFGLFWYIRNYIFMHNPFYPVRILGFKGEDSFGTYSVWDGVLHHPAQMFNAAFAEYKIWLFSVIIGLVVIIFQYVFKRQYRLSSINKLFLIGLINFLFYFTFPTSEQPWIMVSSFRYSLPVFIPLMLGVFLLASHYKKEELIGYIAIANMINVLTMAYYPKLVLIYFPLVIIVFYFLNKKPSNIKSPYPK